jgi:WD40 repeat protein
MTHLEPERLSVTQACRHTFHADRKAMWFGEGVVLTLIVAHVFASAVPLRAQTPTERDSIYRYTMQNQESELPYTIAFSSDGRWICSGNNNPHREKHGPVWSDSPLSIAQDSIASARLWNLESGHETQRFLAHHAWDISSLAFSPDGKSLATTGYSSSYAQRQHFSSLGFPATPGYQTRIWDTQTGEELHLWDKLGGDLAFTNDGKFLVATSSHYGVLVFDTKSGSQVAKWRFRCNDGISPIPMKDPNQMLIVTEDTPVVLNLSTGQPVRRFVSRVAGQVIDEKSENDYRVHTTVLNEDETFLAIGCEEGVLVWDMKTTTEIRRLGVRSPTQALCFSDDSRTLMAIDVHGKRLRWRLETGELLDEIQWDIGKYRFSPNGKLLAFSPVKSKEGYWELRDASDGRSFARFYQPLKERTWACETFEGHAVMSESYENSVRDPAYALLDALAAETEGSTADTSQIQVDSQRVATTLQRILQTHGVVNNREHHSVSNPVAVTSDTATSRAKPAGGKLFVLSVGVSKYKFPEYQLAFSEKDANDFATFFRDQKVKPFQDIFVQVYTDEDATSANLLSGLTWLEQSCTPEDTALVFFSGHGLTARKGLYFLTWEGDAGAIQNTCLNWEHVAKSLTKTPAKQIVFIADCCHAGAFSEERFTTQQPIVDLLAKQRNVTVFCSSSGSEKSLESSRWKNGAFTRSLLEGASGIADVNGDREVSMEEAIRHTFKVVPEWTDGLQHPRLLNATRAMPDFILTRQSPLKAEPAKMQSGTLRIKTEVKDATATLGLVPAGTWVQIEQTSGKWGLGEFLINDRRVKGWVLLSLIEND